MTRRGHYDGDEEFEIEDAECVAETPKALKIVAPSVPEADAWFPKSAVLGGDVQHDGDKGTFVIKRWLAKDRGLT